MLFSKDIEPRCEYCRKALPFENCEVVGCKHKGIMSPGEKCRRFVYDPLRREPEPPRVFKAQEFKKEDFEL